LTSREYTDLGLLTSDEEIGADATSIFNFLTGYSQQDSYSRLIVAPLNLRERLFGLIEREITNKAKASNARIILKINHLTDIKLIDKLYEASEAGVSIDLIVRGTCSLRPGIKGLSENIRVRSVIGRFLEHSRVYYFSNGGGEGDCEVYISSADWMQRNLDRRVEVALPIVDPAIKDYLRETFLEAYLKDNVNSRILKPDGSYRNIAAGNAKLVDSQSTFIGAEVGY